MATATLSLLVLSGPAQAYKLEGERWPTRTITYFNGAKVHAAAVGKAVRAWNRSGARVRFKAVSRRRAKLKIKLVRGYPGGFATIGYLKPGSRALVCCRRGRPYLGRATNTVSLGTMDPGSGWEVVIAHELGHVLGLLHVRGCAIMSSLPLGGCPPAPQYTEHCRVLERDDVRGVVRRYGGRVRLGPRFCPVPPPTELQAAVGATSAKISWRNSTSTRVTGFTIAATEGRCPASPEDGRLASESAQPGAPSEYYDATRPPGHSCYGVWAVLQPGRYSAPAYVNVQVPNEMPAQ